MGDYNIMTKWNFLEKLKTKIESVTTNETKRISENNYESKQDDKPLAEYKETLYINTKSSKKTSMTNSSQNQIYWRDVDSIEKKIDNIHKNRAKKPTSEIDKTVDKIIQKPKKK